MTVLGALLLLVGILLGVKLVVWLGIALLVIGAVVWVAHSTGNAPRHYW